MKVQVILLMENIIGNFHFDISEETQEHIGRKDLQSNKNKWS
ncbi:unnamed protein product [Paramecium sonneborni]|uniref:Uncharacterized protein n=1 Tax=Paramecium sonneborni TaxID=65129 RepID=A0A8S1RSM7_9CILI|nr:unnamed protein product [Paramecium sonneborni]